MGCYLSKVVVDIYIGDWFEKQRHFERRLWGIQISKFWYWGNQYAVNVVWNVNVLKFVEVIFSYNSMDIVIGAVRWRSGNMVSNSSKGQKIARS